ncbi:MAG: hypothetical protein EP330_12130 [Deltaproteobacteria bacterium]|nr:MAG: hypothetical protein EP330_12130 [Deltaproteobacteria bacterium]
MRSEILLFFAVSGCVGVHIGHAPAVPYPITEADLIEPASTAVEGRLDTRFQIPVLSSVAPDPLWIEFNDKRQVAFAQRYAGDVPPTLEDAFHGRIGGNAGASIPVSVVLERVYSGCYPVRMAPFERGQHSFAEVFVDFGSAGGSRVRFTLHEPGCTVDVDEAMAALGDALAAEVIRLSRSIQ